MRKRLIGKAFAIAMSGAMVLTANMFIAMLDLPGMNIGHLRVFILPVMTALLIH